MIEVFVGIALGFIPLSVVCVVIDRRAEARDRVQRRVDQIPTPLPGAYEPWAERALPGRRTHTVVEGEVR